MSVLPKEFKWVEKLKKYEGNPIIRPHGDVAADMIFNPASVVHNNRVGLLCRAINFNDIPRSDPCTGGKNWSVSSLVWGWSDDGINFTLDDKPFLKPDENSKYPGGFEDPRLQYIEDEKLWVLTYTGVINPSRTPGLIALSKDLENWEFLGEVFPDRAVVITPRKINGKYYAYYGNSSIFSAYSEDLRTWHTENKPVLSPSKYGYDSLLCESAVQPIMSDNGILLIYNGACNTRERTYSYRYEYSICWALFDAKDPEKLIAKCTEPILVPEAPHEIFGLSGYSLFASGLVEFNGKHHLYYGCSDVRIGVAREE